ncbi:MAG: right-handed parallel beta-helix repeat-containing protein [Planctomycetota bacterium]
MLRTHIPAAVAAAIVTTAITTPVNAGPLTPPPGAPAPTNKTLNEVEPRTPINADTAPASASASHVISTPGTYYLTANITADQNKSAIEINADDVILDLNGFELRGLGTFTTVSVNGVTANARATIRNGLIRDFTQHAIQGTAQDLLIEGVTVRGGGSGILASQSARVLRCAVYNTGGTGITAGNSSVIEGSIAKSNAFNGIDVATECIVRACVAEVNGGDGIETGQQAVIQGCRSSGNAGLGIDVEFASMVFETTSNGNLVGFDGFANCFFHRCHAANNTSGGFDVTTASHIHLCVASNNTGFGFDLNNATITESVARINTFSGIAAQGSSTVRDCVVFQNDTLAGTLGGIRATGSGNLIEHNVSRNNNGFGIVASGTGNTVVRNWCYDNFGGGYNVPAGNAFGPIVNISAGGNLAGVAFADHHLANFQN